MPNVMFATSQGTGGGGGGGGWRRRRRRGSARRPRRPTARRSTSRPTQARRGRRSTRCRRTPAASASRSRCTRTASASTSSAAPLQGGSGLYRSDDQGATWQHMAGTDTRVANGQGAFSSGVWVDSQNPDILYTVATTVYQIDRRRQDVHRVQGRAGRRGSARIWIDPTNGQRMLVRHGSGPGRHARRRQDLERLLPDSDRADLPHRHRHAVSVLGDGVAAGHRRDHDAQPQRSGPDHGRRLDAAAVIRVRHRRARSAQAHDRVRRRLRRRPGQRDDQDRSRDRTVGQRRAELRRGLEPVHGGPRFLEAVRHRVRSEGDVRRLQLHSRDA